MSYLGYERGEQGWWLLVTEPPKARGVAEGMRNRGAGEDGGAEEVGGTGFVFRTWMQQEAGGLGSVGAAGLGRELAQPHGKGEQWRQRLEKLNSSDGGFGAEQDVANWGRRPSGLIRAARLWLWGAGGGVCGRLLSPGIPGSTTAQQCPLLQRSGAGINDTSEILRGEKGRGGGGSPAEPDGQGKSTFQPARTKGAPSLRVGERCAGQRWVTLGRRFTRELGLAAGSEQSGSRSRGCGGADRAN